MLLRRVVAGTAAVLMTAGVAACGGSGSNGGTSGHPGADPRSAAQLSADRKLAAQALLKLSDFPDGWQAKPSDDDDKDNNRLGDQLADCLDVPPALLGGDSDDNVDSPDFTSPDDQEVSNSVAIAPTTENAEQVFDVLQQPDAASCFEKALEDEIRYSSAHDADTPEDLKVGSVTLAELNLPDYADESVAFRATVPVTAKGTEVNVYVDLVFMRHGRAAAFVSFLNVFSPFPVDDAKHYAAIAESRLTALDV